MPEIDDLLDLLAERRVDDRQEHAPRGHRDADDEQPRPVRPPDVPEQRAAHAAGAPARPPRSARPGLPVAGLRVLVQLEERLLQVRRLDREVRDPVARDRGEERPDVALELAGQAAVGGAGDAADARHALEGRDGVVGDAHLDVALAMLEEARHVLEGDEPTAADDRDAVADPLDLRQHVGREEDRPSRGLEVVEDVVERALHQGIEPLGRLVEDRQLRVVLEGLDDPDLLAHPARVVADGPVQRPRGQLEPFAQLGAAGRRTAGQVAEVVEQPLAGQRVVEGDPAGQVADPSPDLDAVANDVAAEDARPTRRWGGGSRGAAGSSSTCRRRSGRGSRRSRLRGRRSRGPRGPGSRRRTADPAGGSAAPDGRTASSGPRS